MAKRKAGMGRKHASRGLAALSPASSSRKWAIMGVGSRAGAAFLLLCLLLPATVLLSAAASSSSKAAAAAKGGAYPLMAPLVTSWFKKGVGNGNKAPVAASAAATLLVRADGEVDLELAVDSPGSDSASSLLELVSGRRGGGKQQQGGKRLAPASPPSPVEAARAAHALFVSLAARALAPLAQAASGTLRRLAELLQQVFAAAAAAAAHGGIATQKAAHGPLRLVGMIGQAAVALMAAEEKDVGDVGGVDAFSFPRDTGALLGATGRRVAGSVMRAAVQAGGHVGRAGQHVKNQALSSPPAQHAGRLAGVVVQGVATLLNQQQSDHDTTLEEEAVVAAAVATGPHGWFKKRRAASSAASVVSPSAPTRVPFLKPVASPAAHKQQQARGAHTAVDASTEGDSGFGSWALLLLAFAGCGAAAMGVAGVGVPGGALASVVAKTGPVVHIAGGAALRFLERKGVTAAMARVNAYLADGGVHGHVAHGWGRVQEGWAKVLVALAPAREAAERGCFHLGAGKDKAHALLLRLHWQLQQAYSPLATAITPAFHTVNGKAASMAAAIAPAFHNVKGRATGFATESIAALLTWLSEARARLTEKIVWSVIVHKAQGWLNAVLAAVMALVASVCAVWEERVASRRNKQDQTTTKQEQQQATAAAVGVAAPVSPVPSAASEEGRDVKEQQQPSPASAAASKATVEGGKAAFVGASPIPGAAAATLTGYLAATASSFFFPVPTADAGSSSMPPAATESVAPFVVAPSSKEEAKAQEQGAEQEKEGSGEQAKEDEGKQHPLAGSAHSSGSHASGGSGGSSDSDGFEVVGQRAFTPLSDALAPSLPLPIAGTAAADEASLSEDDAALVAAVGHSLAMQQAEAEAEAEEQEQEESAGKKGAVTGVLGRMMLTWGLGGGSDSFVVVEREAANPSSSTSAAAVAAAEKEG